MMNRSRLLLMASLPLILMGSKCQEETQPPRLAGEWKWTCSGESQSVLSLPSCQEQVSEGTPFGDYIREHIRFSEEPKDWNAFFAFGTCVDTQSGTYVQEKNEVRFYDSQGQLTQTYQVTKKSEDHLVFEQEGRSCDLTRDPAPQVLGGMHAKPLPTRLNWNLEIEGSLSSWTNPAQFPFVYQTPLLFAQPNNPSPYRVGLAALHIQPDGSELNHYAGAIYVYDRASGSLLSQSQAFVFSLGQTVSHEFVNSQGEAVVVALIPEQ